MIFGRFYKLLLIRDLKRLKKQGTYFEICALFFKINGLCFLPQAMCFLECAHINQKNIAYLCEICNVFMNLEDSVSY